MLSILKLVHLNLIALCQLDLNKTGKNILTISPLYPFYMAPRIF